MRRWLALATVVGLWWGAQSARAAEPSLADFYGAWQGVAVSAEGLQGVEPEDLNVFIGPDGAGFRMRWMALAPGPGERAEIEVGFEPTGRPGVFAYREQPGSLLDRLFASPATSNPLQGETLLWARLDGPRLTVYSLALDRDGGFRLDRYERTLQDGSLALIETRRTGRGRTVTIEGRLEPAEG